MDYGRTTLALRQGVETIEFLPGDTAPETEWIPLTPESYEHWWTALDARLGLTALFSPAAPATRPEISNPNHR
jgi:hypothetical protein